MGISSCKGSLLLFKNVIFLKKYMLTAPPSQDMIIRVHTANLANTVKTRKAQVSKPTKTHANL